ncbi:hypothetical protein LTR36_000677 [Oleoguttula mirabilis]|uniref:Stress response protein NST1 n=1 Tax=Oleoguttula mirabilis TaxID=1507867 RepID=A0AAV9JQT2_9PEZI|nr:hypothetical protein LTR36_000677 [Oleoguttula mirabilis]
MAANARPPLPPPPPATNGSFSAPPQAAPGGNRKKQKRRAKQAAKAATQDPVPHAAAAGQPPDIGYDEDALGYEDNPEDDDSYDAELEQYRDQYIPPHAGTNGFAHSAPLAGNRNKKRQKATVAGHHAYNPDMLPPLPHPPPPPSGALRPMHRGGGHGHGNVWNTSTAQERQNIKDFWIGLSEEERKSLLKIEKEAVLRKMKQQQKHSCSCTVCGRKRTAIEEELEVLYEGYYEELEQYAHHDHPPLPSTDGLMPDPLQHRRPPHPLAAPPPNPQHRTSNLHEHLDEDEEFSEDEEEEDDEEYSDEEEEYSDEEPEPPRGGVPDFFNFGQNLTVKGILTPWLEKLQQGLKGKADNLLTVADDLLKNDGRKFIEMMEQLAERRMARESEAEYAAANPSHPGVYPPNDPAYNHEDPLAAGEEFDDEEGSYDSQDEYDDDLEEEEEAVSSETSGESHVSCANSLQAGLSEEQRMQEGRRMFQIFAARMFEQRVLTAYREKVAAERQQKLLEELQNEDEQAAQREAKKQRDAAKKKEKKKQQQQAKAEEKARRDAEKAEEEARLREAQEKHLEDQRRKKDEQRKKKDDEKKKQDEERARKDAEKLRRLQQEQDRRDEAERKAREQRAAEKAKKDEFRKREREEREAREKEARDRKVQDDKEKKEREAKAEKDAKERERSAQQAALPPQHQQPAQITKRPSQMGMVAVPGVYPRQTPSGISSPHPAIVTPAVPKAPTPNKARQPSQQSSPKQTQSQVSSAPSKTSSPGSAAPPQQTSNQPKTIMQKPSHPQMGLQHPMQTASPLHQHPMQPPPGMGQHHPGFGGMPPMGFQPFQGPQHPMMHGPMGQRGPMPMYPHQQGPPMGVPNRMQFGSPLNGMPPPPPGMMHTQGRGMGFPYDASGQPPPGFGQVQMSNHTTPMGQPSAQQMSGNDPRHGMPTHTRQPSASEKDRFEATANQPIARPAPIGRPMSVKPQNLERKGSNTDLDDLSKHLGSSALLADDDEPLPIGLGASRRQSAIAGGLRNGPPGGIGGMGGFGSPVPGFGTPASNWNTPSLPSFGQGSGLGQQNWGGLPNPGMGGWSQNNAAFAANGAFGSMGGAQMHNPTGTGQNRPRNIRLAICNACRQLTNASRGEGDGFYKVDILLRQIESNRPNLDSAPSLREIEEICETEGDSGNGGGELHVRKDDAGDSVAVKFEPDAGTPDHSRGPMGLGEIGSPMPSKTSPAGFGAPGMGRGFQSLGAVGSLSNY